MRVQYLELSTTQEITTNVLTQNNNLLLFIILLLQCKIFAIQQNCQQKRLSGSVHADNEKEGPAMFEKSGNSG